MSDAEGKWPVDEMGIPECQRLVYPQTDRIGYPCSAPALVEVRDASGEWVPWCDQHAGEVTDRSRVREPRDVDMEILYEDWIIDRPEVDGSFTRPCPTCTEVARYESGLFVGHVAPELEKP